MKLVIVLIAFLFTINYIPNYNTNTCITSKFDFIEIDPAGNIYIVKSDQLKKFNSKGELLKIYSNKKLGNIYSIDVSNPLKILLFYKDQSQLLFLDSQLSQNAEVIDLLNYNLELTDLVCNSINNGFWLFNRQNNELCRLDKSINKIVSTGNLNVVLSKKINPNYILEKDNFLFINNPEEGILIFDIYGTYYKLIPITGLNYFNVNSTTISYFKNNTFYKFDFLKLLSDEITFEDLQLNNVIKYNNGLLKVFKDSICIIN